MSDDLWQIASKDTKDVFGILRGDAVWLSTVELPYFGVAPDEKKYETSLYRDGGWDILMRYKTKEEAIAGHKRFAKKFNLT